MNYNPKLRPSKAKIVEKLKKRSVTRDLKREDQKKPDDGPKKNDEDKQQNAKK